MLLCLAHVEHIPALSRMSTEQRTAVLGSISIEELFKVVAGAPEILLRWKGDPKQAALAKLEGHSMEEGGNTSSFNSHKRDSQMCTVRACT